MMLLETTVIVLIVSLLIYLWSQTRFVKLVHAIPAFPHPFSRVPILGDVFNALKCTPNELYAMILNTEYARRAGSMMRIWIFFKPYMLVYSGSDAAALLTHPNLTVKSDTHSILKDVVGDNIFTTHGRRWSLYRKNMLPAFRINALRELIPTFVKHALSLTKRLADETKSSNDTDIFSLVDSCAFSIICESTMCMDVSSQVNEVHGRSRFNKAVTRFFELLIERFLSPLTFPDVLYRFTSAKLEYDSEVKYIKDFCRQVIANRRKSLERNNEESNESNENQEKKTSLSLLDILLTAEENGTEFMTEEDNLNNIFALIIAGYETSSTAICWSLFLLGTYPEIQAKVVEELVEVFGDSGRVPDVADLANLKYLERCIKESLRIYPSTPFFERSVDEEIKLDKYTLPAGCHVVFNTYLLHRDPEVFPEPEKFDPDRFLPENCTGRHPFAFLPFGGGPRICIGQKFALWEIKIVLSTILRQFRVQSLQPRDQITFKPRVVLRPHGGLRLRFHERDSTHLNVFN